MIQQARQVGVVTGRRYEPPWSPEFLSLSPNNNKIAAILDPSGPGARRWRCLTPEQS